MSSYKAIVAKIDRVVPIPGADKIQTAYVLGEQVVVGKDWGVGKVGLFFPADCQLSHDFCHHNNLYRDSTKNTDPNKKGFFDDNRKVRCQPFMKVKSEGYFCDLSSLSWCGENNLKLGDTLDTLNGHKFVQKFYNQQTAKAAKAHSSQPKKKEMEAPLFNKHVDTEQFKMFVNKIPAGALLSFHAKVHGTSARMAYTLVKRPKNDLWTRLKAKVGIAPAYVESWEYVVGTRNVLLDSNKKDRDGFHGSEQFRFDVLELVKPHLEKGMTIYGEIAGYANSKPIMGTHSTAGLKDKAFQKKYGDQIVYSYGCKPHEWRFHVYRISYTNLDGVEVDLDNAQVVKWCEKRGLNGPFEVTPSFIHDGDSEGLATFVEGLTERVNNLTEDYIDPTHISEGIIVRVDQGGLIPTFYKSKSYAFKVLEGIVKEQEDFIDMEDAA